LYRNFPYSPKYSTVKSVFKKSDNKNMANYRPISLLTSFSKVFERIIYYRLLQHTEINNILATEQFSFKPSASTEKASFRLTDEILKSLNTRRMAGGIFCDLHKAFDCADHSILLEKLKFYGIKGTALKLITSYLEGRHQRVSLDNNTQSPNWGLIRYGVPQGSILRPLLFLHYINDPPKSINNNAKVVLFADDTSIIINSLNQTQFENTANKVFQL
jgi:hypothetical protein